jgi:hypothetical protein
MTAGDGKPLAQQAVAEFHHVLVDPRRPRSKCTNALSIVFDVLMLLTVS